MYSTDDFIVLSRDSFARVDHVRMIEKTNESCAWCGQTRKSGKMFYYGVWHDSPNVVYWHSKPFCCKSCHDNYYA